MSKRKVFFRNIYFLTKYGHISDCIYRKWNIDFVQTLDVRTKRNQRFCILLKNYLHADKEGEKFLLLKSPTKMHFCLHAFKRSATIHTPDTTHVFFVLYFLYIISLLTLRIESATYFHSDYQVALIESWETGELYMRLIKTCSTNEHLFFN